MNKIGTIINTLLNGKLVGKDEFGNRYYERRNFPIQIGRRNTKRRWVLYKGFPEPTKIPPYWHGWMHHISDYVPTQQDQEHKFAWQKSHLANLTGTQQSYRQSGLDNKRPKVSADYTSWKPNK